MSKRRATGVPRYQQIKNCDRRRTFIKLGQKYAEQFGYRVGVVIMPNENDGPIRMWDNGDNCADFLTEFNERVREGTQLVPYKLASKAETNNEPSEQDFSSSSSKNVPINPVEAEAALKRVSDNSNLVANKNMQVGDTVADCRVSGIAEGGLLDPATINAYHTLGYPIISMSAKGQTVPQSSSGQIQAESPGPSSGKRARREPSWLLHRRLEPVSSDED